MVTETQQPSQELIIIEKSTEIFKTAGQILQTNKTRSEKAVIVGNNILNAIRANGMTPELDERANNYLVNCSAALKEMNESRSEVTKIMDEIKKMYTSYEASISVKTAGTPANLIQSERDAYARKVAEEKREAERKAQEEADRKNQIIELNAAVQKEFTAQYFNHVTASKKKIADAFNQTTLETIADFEAKLNNYTPVLKITFSRTPFAINTFHLVDTETLKQICDTIEADLVKVYGEDFPKQMALTTQHYKDLIPSRINQLEEAKKRDEEIKAAQDAAERERLEKIKREEEEKEAQRKRDEEARIAREAEEQKKQEELNIQAKAEGEKAMTLFEKEAAIAEVVEAPETRTGYDITVTHQVGFVQLFTLWFEKEGKNLPIDKIEKTSFGQIKAWAEKHAHKNNEKIESNYIVYENSYKAVNRKAKA